MTEDLSPESAAAWQAYRSMCASKDDYFSLLQSLDEKYQSGGGPGIAENLRLEKLLSEHDRKVKLFNQAVAAISEPDAKQQLVELLKVAADFKASQAIYLRNREDGMLEQFKLKEFGIEAGVDK